MPSSEHLLLLSRLDYEAVWPEVISPSDTVSFEPLATVLRTVPRRASGVEMELAGVLCHWLQFQLLCLPHILSGLFDGHTVVAARVMSCGHVAHAIVPLTRLYSNRGAKHRANLKIAKSCRS